jgi:MarR family transcriptional regulator, organic hydroperoxide resistance regulator
VTRISRLQQEIGQTRPFRSVQQEAFLSVLRTADVLRRRISDTLEPHGITAQQYNILRILRGAGEQGLPTLAIGERLIEQTPGMTRLLDRMEQKGLVRRHRCKTDRRQVLCYLTPQGSALLESLDPVLDGPGQQGLASLRKTEAEALIQLLDKVRNSNTGSKQG